MAGLSDADQSGLPLPRFHSGRAHRARSRAVPRPGTARGNAWHPGMAQLLLQIPDDRPRVVSRARPFHPVHEAEKHASMDEGRGTHHTPWPGVLRLEKWSVIKHLIYASQA